jgi:hypothetical protein
MGNCCSQSLQYIEDILKSVNTEDIISMYNALHQLWNIYDKLSSTQKAQVKEISKIYFAKTKGMVLLRDANGEKFLQK